MFAAHVNWGSPWTINSKVCSDIIRKAFFLYFWYSEWFWILFCYRWSWRTFCCTAVRRITETAPRPLTNSFASFLQFQCEGLYGVSNSSLTDWFKRVNDCLRSSTRRFGAARLQLISTLPQASREKLSLIQSPLNLRLALRPCGWWWDLRRTIWSMQFWIKAAKPSNTDI